MTLINCPECSREISDRVITCPHCGFPLVEEENEFTGKAQKTEGKDVKPKKTNFKKILIISISIIIVFISIAIEIKLNNDKKAQIVAEAEQRVIEEAQIVTEAEQKAIEEAERKFKEEYNLYIDMLVFMRKFVLEGAINAEKLCNLTSTVWRDVIDSKYATVLAEYTDGYTRPNGYSVDDFNTALENLAKASSTKEITDEIQNNRITVELIVQFLQNPPVGLEVCYDTASELYEYYIDYTSFAIYPSGSYNSFKEEKGTKSDDLLIIWEKLEVQIPLKL